MKKITFTITAIAAILLIFGGCKKKEIDIRDQYIGDWDFEVVRRNFLVGENGYHKIDTIFYLGKISFGNSNDQLNIKYTENEYIAMIINEDGDLSPIEPSYHFGKFRSSDTIYLYLRWGGMGGGITHTINGTKINKGGKK